MQLEDYFKLEAFKPNQAQLDAIQHIDGPLLLVAGPGSGKTRVLLWRTFNLIVFHGVEPKDIFLSTFTEKAARQLRDGLLILLGSVRGKHYDISQMYVGTVHSLCLRILADSRFNPAGSSTPELMDDVEQYFHIYQKKFWVNVQKTENWIINQINPAPGNSQHHRATIALRDLFNRLSEECITPAAFSVQSQPLADMYQAYLDSLDETNKTDMSLLQQKAFGLLQSNGDSKSVFKHLLIDEYQDTNAVQEKIFFHLAQGHKNICVVGDDDQALYRFRGATVENLVQFSARCSTHLDVAATRIDLLTNYRSCSQIIDFYNRFIQTDVDLPPYRFTKTITPDRQCTTPSTTITHSDDDAGRCQDVAELVENLLAAGKVNDANEIAFLYPSVKGPEANSMIKALEARGLSVYSPRSGLFLQSEEAKLIFGLLAYVLGKPQPFGNARNYAKFHQWLDDCERLADSEISANQVFRDVLGNKKLELTHLGPSDATSWNLLDLFYQFLALDTLNQKLALAENAGDEGPSCNLSLISEYLFRFQKMHDIAVIKGEFYGADGDKLRNLFFRDYLYGLYRLQESEYEDSENPFPKGRIPFLTIHQAKGLEFPVVVLGSLNPFATRKPTIETLVRPLHPNSASLEPLANIQQFDAMRMFYVGLSRAENLLVLVNSLDKGATDKRHPGLVQVMTAMLATIPSIRNFNIGNLPTAHAPAAPLPKTYSYTAEYQAYLACPRHYMLFRKYRFAPSRTRTMAFGVLVHKTIEDIHNYFINNRSATKLPSASFIADRIRENYQILAQQTAHQLSKANIASAEKQVDQYWIKLPHIAKAVTDTEVPLTLPGQTTPSSRTYSIHGVVDLVVKDETAPHLYDIKTHSCDTVLAHKAHYEQQLNVYAHIWQTLQSRTLGGTSIIATKLPDSQTTAILTEWNPLVSLSFNAASVTETIANFGAVVDEIESRHFTPKSVSELSLSDPNTYPDKNFAQDVCNRCDGRFSCASYASYLVKHPGDKEDAAFTPQTIESEQDPSNLRNVPMQPDCKGIFLADLNVKGFIKFLVDVVAGNEPIDHQYQVEAVNKHFMSNQAGKIVKFNLLGDAFDGYVWKTRNYVVNKAALTKISTDLTVALQAGNEIDFYKAALACLEWGAGDRCFKLYTANRDWLWIRKSQTNLIDLFNNSSAQLFSDCPNLHGFNTGHYRMNSGLTKIYALAYPDNHFVIYDSRVAAALGKLVANYCASFSSPNAIDSTFLKFAWTGPKKRNPNIGSQHINNNSLIHAEWNIKANWLLNAVVDCFFNDQNPEGFWGCNNRQECLRMLEAALFMVGYSLVTPNTLVNSKKTVLNKKANSMPSNDVENDEENLDYIIPLSGKGKPIFYTGSVATGIRIEWGYTLFNIDSQDLARLLDSFYGQQEVPLHAGMTAKDIEGTLGTWVRKNFRNLTPRHASAIAAVLLDLGCIRDVTQRGHAISLNFRTKADYEAYL